LGVYLGVFFYLISPCLTDNKIKNLKPKEKFYKIFDQGGLYILVTKKGSRLWRYKYRLNKKEGMLCIGSYPELSLKEARKIHEQARDEVKNGIKPSGVLKKNKDILFIDVFQDWFNKQNLQSTTRNKIKIRIRIRIRIRIDKNIQPYLKNIAIDKITTRQLYDILKIVCARGAIETTQRLASILRKIFNDAFLLGYIENNPAIGLNELLPKVDQSKKSNFAHITNKEDLRNILINIDNYKGDHSVRALLQLTTLTFLRSKNIRNLRWEQIDFDKKQIVIGAEEMKMKREHIVPLSIQSIVILKSMDKKREFVFCAGGRKTPISDYWSKIWVAKDYIKHTHK